jgi:hypothetical protein
MENLLQADEFQVHESSYEKPTSFDLFIWKDVYFQREKKNSPSKEKSTKLWGM